MSFKYGQNRDEDDDEYQIIGTPFPPLEADEIVSRRPEIDQTVRDERGRRRFHGAFTGGFSAGYWNTVGSAEGFTPQIFKSSRKDKFDRNQLASKPEDFMDDEDFGSFGIAPKKIQTKDDFVENFSVSSLKDSQMTFDEVIRSVFQPSKESIGKRLYRKMKRLAKLDENLLMDQDYSDKNQTDQSIHSNNHVQATKTNRHGLGYSGMLNTDEVYDESKYQNRSDKNAVITTMKSGRRLQITGEAFGYGALEEDDAMDIYGTDDLSQYDFEIGSNIAPKRNPVKKAITHNQNIKIQIEGFQLCRGNFNLFTDVKRKYRPPELPSNWKPLKRKRTETSGENKKSRWDEDRKPVSGQSDQVPEQPEQSKPNSKQKVMNSNLRAIILGENIVHKSGIVTKTPDSSNKEAGKELEFSKEIAKPVPITVPTVKTPLSGYFASKFTRSSTTSSHTLAGDKPLAAGLNTYQTMSSLSAEERKRNELNEVQNDDQKPPIRSVYEWHPHKILCKRFGVQNPYPQFTDIVGIVCMNPNDKSRNMVVRLNATTKAQSSKSSLFVNLFEDLNQSQTTAEPEVPKFESQKPLPNLVARIEDEQEGEEEEEVRPPPPKPPIDLFKSIFESDEEEDKEEEKEKQVQSTFSSNEEQSNRDDVMKIQKKDSNSNKNYGIFSGIDFDQLEQESFELSNAPTPNVATNSNEKPNKEEDNNSNDDDDDDEDFYGPALPPTNPSQSESVPKLLDDNDHFGQIKNEKSSNKSSTKKKRSKKMKKEKSAKKEKRKSRRKSKKTKRSRRRSTSSSSSSNKSSDSFEETSLSNDNETNKLMDDGHVKDKIIELISKVKKNKHHS